MLRRFTEPTDLVLGFTVSGKLTATDYEDVLMPDIERAVSAEGKVRIVMEWDESFAGWEPKALLDDAKLGFAHWNHFERLALVGSPHWIDGFIKLFDKVSKGKVKVFAAHERDAALEWARE